MENMKKILILAALALVVLGGCKDKDDTTPTPEPEPAKVDIWFQCIKTNPTFKGSFMEKSGAWYFTIKNQSSTMNRDFEQGDTIHVLVRAGKENEFSMRSSDLPNHQQEFHCKIFKTSTGELLLEKKIEKGQSPSFFVTFAVPE